MKKQKLNSTKIIKWYAEQMWNEHTSYLQYQGFLPHELVKEREKICKNFQNIENCNHDQKLALFEVFLLRRDLPTDFFDDVENYFCSHLKGFDVPDFFQKYMLRKMDYVLTFQELSTIDPNNKNRLHRPSGCPIYTNAQIKAAKVCYS